MAVWRGRRGLPAIAAIAAISWLAACGPTANPATAYPLISLERTSCLGSCPDYVVAIDGRGTVTFSTDEPAVDEESALHHRLYFSTPAVLMPGPHTDRIALGEVEELVKRFQAIEFFNLKDRYEGNWTDLPTFKVSIDTGDRRKQVIDYMGGEVGMPESVSDLEDEIDRVAGTARWVSGADGLVGWLEQQKFDFKSNIAAMLLTNGADEFGAADEKTLVGLVERGAPLDVVIEGSRFHSNLPVGAEVMWAAILNGRINLFTALHSRGWLEKLGPDQAADAFARGAGGCNPNFVDIAASAGIEIDAVPKVRSGLDFQDTDTATALAHLGTWRPCDDDSSSRVKVAESLIARGADPNKRDARGETAIFEVYDIALLDFLLAHGADPTARNNDGNSAAFSTEEDEIVARLLEAGASPSGKFYDGETLAERVKKGDMPATAAWISKHGVNEKAPR